MAHTQPLRSDLRQGVPPVVPLADRVIGNMRQWLIGIDPTSVQNFRHCSKGCRGVEGACCGIDQTQHSTFSGTSFEETHFATPR